MKTSFVYAAAVAFRLKCSSCMFGYQKKGIYCSWVPSFIAFATQQRSKQLGAAFVATVLQHSKQWRALQQRDNQPFPFPFPFFSFSFFFFFCTMSPLFTLKNSGAQLPHHRPGPPPLLLLLLLLILLLLLLHHVSTVWSAAPSPPPKVAAPSPSPSPSPSFSSPSSSALLHVSTVQLREQLRSAPLLMGRTRT